MMNISQTLPKDAEENKVLINERKTTVINFYGRKSVMLTTPEGITRHN